MGTRKSKYPQNISDCFAMGVMAAAHFRLLC
jgi:hypothetical protein